MRFNELVHWSDGLFLQPHHMQEMQRSFIQMGRVTRDIYLAYAHGIVDFEIDSDALDNRRIVVKRLSAIMPDGQEISMPGNTSVPHFTVELPEDGPSDVTIYLAVPTWSEHEANLNESGTGKRIYTVKEYSIKDENTGDNEIVILKRTVNTRLLSDIDQAKDCSVIPLLKLTCVSRNAAEPKFAISPYMPPYLFVTKDCPLMTYISELVFQLGRRRDKILSDIAETGYNAEEMSGKNIYAVLQLQALNKYEARLSALLSTEKTQPFVFYFELRSLLGELAALQPLSKREEVSNYNHANAMPVFKEVITNIRTLIMAEGYAGYTRIDFNPTDDGLFYEATITEEDIIGTKDYYVAVVSSATPIDVVKAVESGDKFKLINPKAKTERIRGVKLQEMRYPPRYLPVLSNASWFKVVKEDSVRIWRDICNEHEMLIDYAHDLFTGFGVSFFITSVKSEDVDE